MTGMPRHVGAAFAAVALVLAAYQAHLVLDLGDPSQAGWKLLYDATLLVVSALGILRAARAPERLPWLLVSLGVLAWSLGDLYFTLVLAEAATIPYPSPADAGYLLFPPLVLAGALTLLRARAGEIPKAQWADGAVAALAVAAVCAAMVIQPILDSLDGDLSTLAFTLVNPLADLVLLAVIVGILAGTGWRLDRTWVLLAAGTGCFWLADSLFLVATARGTYQFPSLFDAGWCIGLTLLALAGWQRPEEVRDEAPGERLRLIVMPLLFAGIGLATLVHAATVGSNPLAVAFAACSLLAVMVRLSLTFTENVAMLRSSRHEAATDPLTGLGNRRALLADLNQALAARTRSTTCSSCATSTGSRATTTPSGTRPATRSCARLGSRLAGFVGARAARTAWAATSSAS